MPLVASTAMLGWLAGLARASPPPEAATLNSGAMSAAVSTHTNRLAGEKSPYLLQHQHNPVDWFPWGDEAFARARAERRPIFLSIGYSTCHWCHVMERESFENPDIARFLNDHFVSIKVDREERPDVDQLYMTFVQATTGQGGWPLTAFLTPELRPFYGGTYFPPDSRHGRPGFLALLQQVHQAWQDRRAALVASADDLHRRLTEYTQKQVATALGLDAAVLTNAAALFKQEYDPRSGGFGGAPKFPRPAQPAFLLAYGTQFDDPAAVQMVLHTCTRMAAGGIHDQLGGGFARYSVDAQWLVPHFEKMLYDNAQLVQLYLDAYVLSGQPAYAQVVRDIIGYVLRDLTDPAGGFYSAEDADSEGKEGKFYCWTRAELRGLLPPAEFTVVVRYFGVTEQGNFVDHSDPHPLPHQNVLSVVNPTLGEGEARLLAAARARLLAARAQRVRPHRDDKTLASWNGLMLGALARAAVVLEDATYRAAAEKNLAFLQAKLWDARSRTLYHRWRDGEHDRVQLLEGYAFLLAGVLDLYEATLEPRHLEFAAALADAMISRFYDAEHGGFWQTAATTPNLILRLKDDYDGALPSGNAVAILDLLRLDALTERAAYRQAAEKSLRLFTAPLHHQPQALPAMLLAVDFSLQPPKRVVVAGDPAAPATRRLLRAIHGVYQPRKVVLGTAGPVEPFARTLPAADHEPTAYVCTSTACQPPTHDPAQLARWLR